jgi:hypothetical protein
MEFRNLKMKPMPRLKVKPSKPHGDLAERIFDEIGCF